MSNIGEDDPTEPIDCTPWIDTTDPANRISLAQLRDSGMLEEITRLMFGAPMPLDIKGCFWPPTGEHLRACHACQQMAHIERLEAQVEEARS